MQRFPPLKMQRSVCVAPGVTGEQEGAGQGGHISSIKGRTSSRATRSQEGSGAGRHPSKPGKLFLLHFKRESLEQGEHADIRMYNTLC